MRKVALLPVLLSLAGCYYYRPLTRTPEPEMSLSVTLTDSGSDAMGHYLGTDVGTVRGRLLFADDSSYGMSVSAVDLRHGTTLGWKGERAVLNRTLVAAMSERRFSVGRTALTTTLSAAGFWLTLQAFKIVGGGSSSSGGGGKPR